jgi:phenylacetate-coenzyme A ligase PaaK-like adenylate-forming protein
VKSTGENGFLRTGDLGFIEDNHLYIVSRLKDIIIINGKNYYSSDIEKTVKENLDLPKLPCTIFSYEFDGKEKIIVIQEVEKLPYEKEYIKIANDIIRVISEKHQLEVYEILFVEKGSIPVTSSNKISRIACKKIFSEERLQYLWRHQQSNNIISLNEEENIILINKVVELIRKRVLIPELGQKVCHINDTYLFSQLGLDSIRYIRIARKIEAEFNVHFKPSMLYVYTNCRSLAEYLIAQNAVQSFDSEYLCWDEYQDGSVLKILRECSQGVVTIEKAVKMIKEGM